MNVFDYAMQMEYDGKEYYLELASKSEEKGVQSIFLMLANDEEKHYETFKKMRDRDDAYQMAETEVIINARNIFKEMLDRIDEISVTDSQVNLYQRAQDMERKSRDFYQEKAGETENAGIRELLEKVASEEQRHFDLLENIIDFVSKPRTWLENAEFSHIGEEY